MLAALENPCIPGSRDWYHRLELSELEYRVQSVRTAKSWKFSYQKWRTMNSVYGLDNAQ
jgi:hypothetical protein